MALRPEQFHVIGRALIASAALIFALAASFWNGFIELDASARPLITMALACVGVLDLGIGLFFLRKARA